MAGSFKNKLKAKYEHYRYENKFPASYEKAGKAPVKKNKVVFLEVHKTQLYGSMKYLYDRMKQEKKYDLKVCYLRYGVLRGKEFDANTEKVMAQIADARWIVIMEAVPVFSFLKIRPETKVVHLGHGPGVLRCFGYDHKGKRSSYAEKLSNYKNVDYVITASEKMIPNYVSAIHVDEKNVLPLGCAHTDQYFSEDFKQESVNKLHQLIPETEGKKIVLYAPTFKGKTESAYSPFILGEYKLIKERLGRDYILLLHHHPLAKKIPTIGKLPSDFTKDITEQMTLEEAACAADILVTDCSSALFDFTLLDKPLVFLIDNYEKVGEQIGFYYDYPSFVPGPICRNTYAFAFRIKNNMEIYDKEKIEAFRKEYMAACDGNSTKRIIEFMDQWMNK